MPDFTSHRTRLSIRAKAIAACWLAVAVAAFAFTGCGSKVPPQVSINGKTWLVELAVTPEQHFKGLSGRMSLSPDTGMLFIFPDSAVREFCMRGCYIPLDVAFINADRRIVRITTMIVEADLAGRVAYSSEKPVKYALEVPAGAFRRSGVKAGDKVECIGDIPNK